MRLLPYALAPLLSLPLVSTTSPTSSSSLNSPLTGRFLHLTDLHPDPYYSTNSPESSSCHSPSSSFDFSQSSLSPSSPSLDPSDRLAGYFGLPLSTCDSPPSLINATLSFLSENFKDQLDFIVWTGDNARHDIDESLPRTSAEIQELNKFVAEGIRGAFGRKVKVVASLGNNDVWPHNIMFPGPTELTNSMLNLWRSHQFIPEAMRHTFSRGGYYSLPILHDQLLLISLNTIYFFEKNTAVDGCPRDSGRGEMDPGSEQLLWLEQQLYLAKEKGMKVWLTGHVPPNQGNWYEECLGEYTKLSLEYNDIILGQLFGHMNQDHFSFLTNLDLPSQSPSTLSSDELPSTLYHSFSSYNLTSYTPSQLSKLALSNFSTILINPSVIPTYLPTFRIWEYSLPSTSSSYLSKFHSLLTPSKKKIEPFTPTSYTQFFIPLESITLANKCASLLLLQSSTTPSRDRTEQLKSCEPSWEIEYTTLPCSKVIDRLLSSTVTEEEEEEKVIKPNWMPSSVREHLQRENRTRKGLERLLREVDLCPYEIEGGMGTEKWLKVARDLVLSREERKGHWKKGGRKGKGKGMGKGRMWRRFVERMGVRTDREEL